LAGRIAGVRDDLDELAQALMGTGAGVAQAVEQRPRVTLYESRLSAALKIPRVTAADGTPAILENYGQIGFRDRSFDIVVPVTAPNPINDTGNSYDAGAVYDGWILNPSVDTKIDFDKPCSQNTPFISANSRMMFAVRKQKVYYLANLTGLKGVMQIWLFKFAD
jgi:hypothetical protein